MNNPKTTGPRGAIAKKIFEDFASRHARGDEINNPEVLLDNLTLLQRNFIRHYIEHLDGARAIKEAKFLTKNPDRVSWQLLVNPKIALTIELLQLKRARKSRITNDYVLQKIKKIVENTEEDNPQAALRGLELIGKHLKMFVDRTEVTGADGAAIKYEKITEDAQDFTSSIAGLAERANTNKLKVVGGTNQ